MAKNDSNNLVTTNMPMSSAPSTLVTCDEKTCEVKKTSVITPSNNGDITTTTIIVSEKKREKFSKDSNGERIRDSDGYRLRAAGLCTRMAKDGQMELLLVSGRGNSNSWVRCIRTV